MTKVELLRDLKAHRDQLAKLPGFKLADGVALMDRFSRTFGKDLALFEETGINHPLRERQIMFHNRLLELER